MAHLARPVGAGGLDRPDATGSAGTPACGDTVHVDVRVRGGTVVDAGFRAFGCGATTAAASAACARIRGAPVEAALRLTPAMLDADLGGLGPERLHGAEQAADAVARAFERWYSDRLGAPGLPRARDRVVVGMSGGVDSAVAAALLLREGLDVVGVTMRLWHDPSAAAAERSCCSPDTVRLARAGAHHLGIPHITLDAVDVFRRGVVEEFIAGYRRGETPNPCVTCNGTVRFAVLDRVAALVGARWIATGHYARIVHGVLARGADPAKDQSYMLARLETGALRRLLLPVGGLAKDRVRALARELDLPAAEAVESQEVCFVGAGGYVPFLERAAGMAARAGDVLDESGAVVGAHDGYWRYTVGQRRGVGVAAQGPRYVLGTDPDRNTVVIGPRERLATGALILRDVVLREPVEGVPLEVRVRYRGRALRGRVSSSAAGMVVELDVPADGVAPGQTAALYRDGRLVGAGIIVGGRSWEASIGQTYSEERSRSSWSSSASASPTSASASAG